MPIYEFICGPCDQRFEILTTFSRAAEAKCPKCGSGDLKRVMSMFASRSSGNDGSSSEGSGCAGCASGACSTCGHH